MAKSLLRTYVLNIGTAGNGTLILPGKVDLGNLLLVTNTTRNVIYYNFADTTFAGTTATFTRANNSGGITATSTTNSASSGGTSLTATTATGTITVGMVVSGSANIPTGTTITAISGTTLTLSTATTGAVSNASLTFTGASYAATLSNSDGYTTVSIQVDSSTHNKNDQIQIFIEKPEQLVRMSGIQTDAFERMRVAQPQSMLDADFEYGLQPTKWQVINSMRGYPSIYELPGTDLLSTAVVTDASNGTSGTGASLITFTTQTPHSLTAGTPITTKALLNTVSGFARAEGTFLVNAVTGTNTFNYYAKAKVGASLVSATSTTNSASSGSTTLTATTATGTIVVGMVITGSANIPAGTTVTAVSGTTLTISAATTSTVSNASLTFSGEVLSTTYTQLRRAAFFTGAQIGNPALFVSTQSDGSTTTAIIEATWPSAHGLVPGNTLLTTISSSGSNHGLCQGPFYVESVPDKFKVRFTARAIGVVAQTTLSTFVITGTAGQFTCASTTLTTNQPIRITGTYGGGGSIDNYATGNVYYIQTGGTGTSFVLLDSPSGTPITTTAGTPTGLTITAATLTGAVYARPDCFYQHRPFDGGVMLGTGGPAHMAHAVRQSKKYIRYQSGKAINYNTGALFAPNYDIRTISANGTAIGSTITITTDDVDHACQVGAVIDISGVTTTGYNGRYTVVSVTSERVLTVTAYQELGSVTAKIGSPCLLSLYQWVGATVRAGTFDDQNGQFWQYDGQTMAVGYRSSTFQTAGVVDVVVDSNTVNKTSSSATRFQEQFAEGDRVVLKGMSHVVTSITNNDQMSFTPDYRGSTNVSGVKMLKTREFIFPQSQWNIDRCDGTGGPFNPSGYNLQVNKMQMVGIAWTWYGAGFIEWQLRGSDGNYIAVHRVKASNVNTEAYMRSGNQPVRYEVINEGARTQLAADLLAAGTTATVNDTSSFPTSGYLWLEGEIVKYTGKTLTTFTGLTRAATDYTLFAGGQNRTFTGGPAQSLTATNTGVILISHTATPIISHWGSAFLTDGGFDTDRGYIFNYAASNIAISQKRTTAFAIRLAPSVSNAIIGDLGARELLNRAQLLLQGIEITAGGAAGSNAGIVVEGVLNPINYPSNLANITWGSLQASKDGGLPSFAQVAPNNLITFENQVNSVLTTTPSTSFFAGVTSITVNSASGVAVGDEIWSTASGATFAGGTVVTSVSGTTIGLSRPTAGQLTSGTTNISFSRSTSAAPGETIFSFISSPSSRDTLDLKELKELVNTPIGGRGTFPNGPDVLMINVYLTQGPAITGNLILRWGEAQA